MTDNQLKILHSNFSRMKITINLGEKNEANANQKTISV